MAHIADPEAAPERTGVDTVGAVCSTLCAAHCASAALMPSILVALGLGALLGPTLEWGFTAVALVVASLSVVSGWRRKRARWALLVLAGGIVGLASGRLLETVGLHHVGATLSIASGLALAVGHIAALRSRRKNTRATPPR